MSTLEDRLRAAFQEAAETVTAATIRGPGELRKLTGQRPPRAAREPGPLSRMLIPLTSASAVATVALVAVLVPRAISAPGRQAAAPELTQYMVTYTGRADTSLEVRNATTGALTRRIPLPYVPPVPAIRSSRPGQSPITLAAQIMQLTERGGPGDQLPAGATVMPGRIGALATGNGRTFIVAVYLTAPCRSWLYRFQLSSQGLPSPLTPLAVLPSTRYAVTQLAVSGNERELAYVTGSCAMRAGNPSYLVSLAVTGLRDGITRQWPFLADLNRHLIRSLSLTANGRQLAFGDWSAVTAPMRVMPTDAAPGNVAERSRIVLRPPVSRPTGINVIDSAAISAGGSLFYLTISAIDMPGIVGDMLAGYVGTGRLRSLDRNGEILAASPSMRYLLLEFFSIPPANRYSYLPQVQLARLDLVTWKLTYLPSGWVGGKPLAYVW